MVGAPADWCSVTYATLGDVKSFDAIAIVIVLVGASAGWRAGVIGTLLSLIGFAGGLALAIVLLPRLALALPATELSGRNAVLTGGFLLLPILGSTIARAFAGRGAGQGRGSMVSKLLGAVVALVAVCVVAWIVIPVSSSSARVASWTTGSATARLVADLPNPPVDVGKLIAQDSFPTVVSDALGVGQSASVPQALPAIAPALLAMAEAASVQVFVKGCGVSRSGSGFVAGNGIVVTNAHVVAGGSDGADIVSSKGQVHATVVAFDPSTDLAVLSVPKLVAPALKVSTESAAPHETVITLGHPNAQRRLDVSPALTLENKFLPLIDIYGGTTSRLTTVMASDAVKPGSSGSAVINTAGEVVAVVYGTTTDASKWALAVSNSELSKILAKRSTAPVSAGACPSSL